MTTNPRTFSISSCLGRGGFGEVYQATMNRDGGLETEVAIKVLRRDVDPQGQAVQRLRDEGRLLSRLEHPAILKVYDLILLEGRVSLITELVDGEDLEQCFEEPDPIGLRALIEVIGHVAGALHTAWNAPVDGDKPLRLVHRDIKPSNIRIGRRGVVKLLDFGIARTDEVTREAKTMTDMLIGSPPYMAPERFLDNQARPASDVFALGAALYEGVTGERLFDMPVTMLAGHAVDQERYEAFVGERLARLEDELPAQALALLTNLLAYEPEARFTAAELSEACLDVCDELGGPTLARWARERAWPSPEPEKGDLDGRVLVEGTLERATPIASMAPTTLYPVAPAPRARSRWGFLLGGVTLAGGGIMVAVALLLGVGAVIWSQQTSQQPVAEVPLPQPTTPAAPAPAPVEELEPEPAPIAARPEPVVERPVVRPRPSEPAPVEVAPVEVKPAPRPKPVVPKPAQDTGSVQVSGGVGVQLVSGSKVLQLPAEVPGGDWSIEARFNESTWSPAGKINVVPGRSYMIRCGASLWTCRTSQL